MKKLSVFMAAMLVVSGAAMAQGEETGSAGAGSGASAAGSGLGAIGGIATGTIVAGAIAAGVLAAVVSNNRSDSPVNCPTGQTLVNGTCQPNKTLQCEGSDPLVGGVCTGTTTTVTVSGTSTITVPVTFTYAPTLR
ncbi:hypothetical protein [Rheinheimera soli]|uniref:Glycine zipper domain-containing protein n=1 Tax=Rheinheimera soli TaxID=443616 RepID=A0ABU1VV72_9GAMM|nr:hypothetical protein [Rheinheimera soli]MDR7119328.1 hypothetical protein [Rheinheimera soli]